MPTFENSKGQKVEVPQAHDLQSMIGNGFMREKAAIGIISAQVDKILNFMTPQEGVNIKTKSKYERIDRIRSLGTPDGWDQEQQDAIMKETAVLHEDQLQEGELKERLNKLKE